MGRPEAMRVLGVGNAKIHELTSKGELRSWRVGRETFLERAEVEALAGRDGQGSVLREATALLKQSHAHNAAAMGLLVDQAQSFARLTGEVVKHLLERNEKLEKVIADQRDLVAKAHESEAESDIRLLETEGELERKRALYRAAERAFPILLARLQGAGDPKDAAIAAVVRTIAADPELVGRLKAGLPPVEAAQVDALVKAAE